MILTILFNAIAIVSGISAIAISISTIRTNRKTYRILAETERMNAQSRITLTADDAKALYRKHSGFPQD